jgi:hypothetical protein
MYQMLAHGQWLISDTCPQLISAIPSRVHDPQKPGDLLKVGGDPLDDVMVGRRRTSKLEPVLIEHSRVYGKLGTQ